jgi:hypothetical protein
LPTEVVVTTVAHPTSTGEIVPATLTLAAPALPRGDTVEDELVAHLIGNFHYSLEVCLNTVLHGGALPQSPYKRCSPST